MNNTAREMEVKVEDTVDAIRKVNAVMSLSIRNKKSICHNVKGCHIINMPVCDVYWVYLSYKDDEFNIMISCGEAKLDNDKLAFEGCYYENI